MERNLIKFLSTIGGQETVKENDDNDRKNEDDDSNIIIMVNQSELQISSLQILNYQWNFVLTFKHPILNYVNREC